MDATAAKPASEPVKKASPAFLAVCALVLVFAVGLRIKQALDLRHPIMAETTLRGRTFRIEIADTAAKRELGLGERDSLAADAGMYFPLGVEQRWVFWMKGMRFPIDIIWIRDGRIVDIEHSVPPPTTLPLDTFAPAEPADAVLELNAGVAMELGLKPGDLVCLGVCPEDSAITLKPATTTPETAPPAEPERKTYPDEDASPGTYANAELGMAFAYPIAWGDAIIKDATFVGFDTGKRARAHFTATTTPIIDLFSGDWAIGVGEGWSGRLKVTGDPTDPIDSLAEAQSRLDAGGPCGSPPCIVSFKKLANGYRIGYQYQYGTTYLLAVYLAPAFLREGEYRDVQWVVHDVATKGPENEADTEWSFTTKEADAAMAAPGMKARLDEAEKAFVSMHPYEAPAP